MRDLVAGKVERASSPMQNFLIRPRRLPNVVRELLAIAAVFLLGTFAWRIVGSFTTVTKGGGNAGPANLQTAMTGATIYYSRHGGSFAGLDQASWNSLDTGLSGLSGGEASSGPHAITDFWPVYQDCLGVLIVHRPLTHAFFGGYPITSKVGTFYFVGSSSSPSSCSAASVQPAPTLDGQVGLSPTGWDAINRPGLGGS
jgi:hypothetical protein